MLCKNGELRMPLRDLGGEELSPKLAKSSLKQLIFSLVGLNLEAGPHTTPASWYKMIDFSSSGIGGTSCDPFLFGA